MTEAAPPPRILAGQHAVVTGGARGIGVAIAEALHAAGATLTLIGRDRTRLAEVAQRLEGTPVVLDVTDEDAVANSFAALGAIDILVNSAGAAFSAPLARTSRADWERLLAVNLTAPFLTCRAAVPGMVERKRGRIVNIASTAGLTAYRDVAAYVASKHGLIGMTRALALEIATSGVTVNAVCPGYVDTDMFRAGVASVVAKTGRSAEDAARLLVKGNPQGRVLRPDEIAHTVLWLCHPASGSITGQSIAIAGGEVMH